MPILFDLNPASDKNGWLDLEDLFKFYLRRGKTPAEVLTQLQEFVKNGCKVKVDEEEAENKLIWKLPLNILQGIWSLKQGDSFLPGNSWDGIKCIHEQSWRRAGKSLDFLRRIFSAGGERWELFIYRDRHHGTIEPIDPEKHVFRKVERNSDGEWLRLDVVPGCARCSTMVFGIFTPGTRVCCMSCGHTWDIV